MFVLLTFLGICGVFLYIHDHQANVLLVDMHYQNPSVHALIRVGVSHIKTYGKFFHKKFLNTGPIFCKHIPKHGSVLPKFYKMGLYFEKNPLKKYIFLSK